MPRPPKIWLISDTHFYHQVMVKECGWPPDYKEQVLRNCKQLVAQQDILFHLGDVIFYKYPELSLLLGEIPGKKILLYGNHDHKSKYWYMRNGFDFVAEQIIWEIFGVAILFSHVPQPIPEYVDYNIHGHLHLGEVRSKGDYEFYSDKHILVSPEKENFQPIDLQTLLNR